MKLHAGDVPSALLDYSMARVPEGHALLELSMGPSNGFGKTLLGLKNLLDGAGVTGSKQLQVLLTTTLKPFQEIRKELSFSGSPQRIGTHASTWCKSTRFVGQGRRDETWRLEIPPCVTSEIVATFANEVLFVLFMRSTYHVTEQRRSGAGPLLWSFSSKGRVQADPLFD